MLRLASLSLVLAVLFAACDEKTPDSGVDGHPGSPDASSTSPDAPVASPDARPGQPDAPAADAPVASPDARQPDARPGQPDAAAADAPIASPDARQPDARPGQPDAASPQDAASPPDASTGAPDAGTTGGKVRFIGRWDTSDPTAPRANFSGSAALARFSGTQVSVKLDVTFAGGDPYFVAVVDGGTPSRIKARSGASTYTLKTGLTAGTHTVQVSLETEGMYGNTRFLGFDLAGGQLLDPPAPALRFEVIGDSISCGYGNHGTVAYPPTCSWSTDSESAYMAYGSVLGRMFGADVSTICWSGKGVYEDNSGNVDSSSEPQMVTVYQDALIGDGWNGVELHQYRYPATGQTATPMDAVIIDLGTNDMSGARGLPPAEPFKTAYLKLLTEVRANSPNAHIFLTIGPMTTDPQLSQYRALLDTVIAASGDAKVHRVDVDPQDGNKGLGCDWHPSAAEDLVMAQKLRSQIAPILGVSASETDPNPLP